MSQSDAAAASGGARRNLLDVLPIVAYRGALGGYPILLGFYVANRWGLEILGSFTVASALTAVALIVSDFGASRLLPRELAVLPRDAARAYVASANLVRLAVTVAIVGGANAVAYAGAFDRTAAIFISILMPVCFIALAANNAVSERIVSRELAPVLVAVIAGVVVLVGGLVAARFVWDSPYAVAAAYLVSRGVETAVLVRGRGWVTCIAGGGTRAVALALLPFVVQAALGVIYSRVSVFVVEHFGTRTELGLLSAASGLQGILLLVPTSIALLYYPRLTVAERQRDRSLSRHVMLQYFASSMPAVGAGVLLVGVAFGYVARFLRMPIESRAFTVAFMSIAFLTVITSILGVLLQSAGGEHAAARLSGITVAACAAYQMILVPILGLWGVVAGAAAAELTTILLFLPAVRAQRAKTRLE